MKKPSRRTWLTALGAAIAGAAGLLLPVLGPVGEAEAAPTGLRVDNGRLYEANGNEFVMRGVNHAHAWYPERAGSIADIAAKGANTVRIVLSSGDRWTRTTTDQVSSLIDRCRTSKLICVLETHDTTGYGEEPAAASLDRAADYWISLKSALVGQEDYVVVNIGNEPFGNNDQGAWTNATKSAIGKLRGAGLRHALMVDAPAWGQDWAHVMRDNAASVFAADPDRNTIFSVHMYGVYDTAAEVQSYLNHFVSNRLPLVIGEFGDAHSDGNPDENAIMATAQSLRIGYLGWSWSGNGGGVEYLDMVNGFDPASLTPWGNRLLHGANGISATSKKATVYGGGPVDDIARNGYPYCARGTTTDPDGDGWGWENNRSCVVRGGPADTAPNGYRYCAQGSATDPDGDGWGWENNRSCVVRHGSADR
ncbi:cellulase family glycosylhydrolase [Streptomyces sp. NPDC058700]|uniref:cellulase family glycosylhydrolase n=1 Tax=unclassified Streptomyces TaxID=2593676 RepID=UPI003653B797